MQSALIYRADIGLSNSFSADMERHGWTVDTCQGMLEMLRRIEEREYEIVVINADHMDVEIYTLVSMIKELSAKPKILLKLARITGAMLPADLLRTNSVVVGDLTWEKLVKAANENC